MEVCCVKQYRGTNNAKRCDEIRLIFHLDTLGLHGLKMDFINSLMHMHFYLSVRVACTTVYLFNDMSHSEINCSMEKGIGLKCLL